VSRADAASDWLGIQRRAREERRACAERRKRGADRGPAGSEVEQAPPLTAKPLTACRAAALRSPRTLPFASLPLPHVPPARPCRSSAAPRFAGLAQRARRAPAAWMVARTRGAGAPDMPKFHVTAVTRLRFSGQAGEPLRGPRRSLCPITRSPNRHRSSERPPAPERLYFDHHRLDAFHVPRGTVQGDAIARSLPRGYGTMATTPAGPARPICKRPRRSAQRGDGCPRSGARGRGRRGCRSLQMSDDDSDFA